MAGPLTLFELGQRAMSSQLVRMNAAASNLANAGSVAATEDGAYRPLRPVFAEQLDAATSCHPLADENGDVWVSPVDENAEMVEMMEASRQYRNVVDALSTAKQLMLETMRMK